MAPLEFSIQCPFLLHVSFHSACPLGNETACGWDPLSLRKICRPYIHRNSLVQMTVTKTLKTPLPPQCSFGLILPRLDTTPGRGRILSRLRRIFNPHCSAPDQPPPLQVLLNLPLHTTLIVFRFPDGHTHPSLVPILTPNYSNQKPNEQPKTSGQESS